MTRRIAATVSLLVSLLLLSGLAVAATPARVLSPSAAIEVAQKEVARPTEVAATSHVTGSDRWTVSLRQEGARPEDRVYVTVDGSGRAVGWGWLDDGKLKPAAISKAQALTLAKSFAGYGYYPFSAGLVLTPDTLTWKVTLARSGSRYQVTLDAFTGKPVGRSTPPAAEEPVLLSRAAAVAVAKEELGAPAEVVNAQLDNAAGQEKWVVTLYEKEQPTRWHIFVLNAADGQVLQRLRVHIG